MAIITVPPPITEIKRLNNVAVPKKNRVKFNLTLDLSTSDKTEEDEAKFAVPSRLSFRDAERLTTARLDQDELLPTTPGGKPQVRMMEKSSMFILRFFKVIIG